MNPACGPRSNMGHRCSAWLFLRGIAPHVHRNHCIASPLQDLGTHALEMQDNKEDGEGDRHNEKRHKQSRINGWPPNTKNTCRLMKCVPPIHRKFNNWDIDRADKAQDCSSASGPAWLID